MPQKCLKCEKSGTFLGFRSKIVPWGFYYRTSDSRRIQRYRCLECKSCFSSATFHPCYKQKKRQKNEILRVLLSSGLSQRRAAKILRLSRVTVVRKFVFLGLRGELAFRKNLRQKAHIIEFDDLETFEHTKCKPLSITLAVESKTRRILGIEVAQMAAKGLLVAKAKKYGRRIDHRTKARRRLLIKLAPLLADGCIVKSDQNPHYAKDVHELLPNCEYKQYKGKRGAITGQGELKKVGFDPLFSLNHTCAKLRADINRLFRRTWCTTKKADRLYAHLMIYANYHNNNLGIPL